MRCNYKYSCKHCDRQFLSKSLLAEHQRVKHRGLRYPCTQCNKQFTQKGHRARHQRSVHERIKYPCNQCSHSSTLCWYRCHTFFVSLLSPLLWSLYSRLFDTQVLECSLFSHSHQSKARDNFNSFYQPLAAWS